MTEPIEVTEVNDRGFHDYGTPVETDFGHTVRIRESSISGGPFVWLFAEGSVFVEPGTQRESFTSLSGEHVYERGSVGVHLNEEMAVAVITRLQAWINEINE